MEGLVLKSSSLPWVPPRWGKCDCLHFQNSRGDLGTVCRVHKTCQTFERAMKIGSVVMSCIVKDEILGQILVAGRVFGVGSVS